MSRNDHIIRKKPIFSGKFQHRENFVPFRNLKKLNLSKNTLQNLTVTNATTNIPNLTTVRYFLPYGKILKGDTLRNYWIFPLNAINVSSPLGGVSQKVKPSEKKFLRSDFNPYATIQSLLATPIYPCYELYEIRNIF